MIGRVSSWAAVAALAGFLFGFDTAVISGAEQAVQREWRMSDAMHGLAISSALWGTVIGALLGGWPADRYGRKPALIAIGVLYAVSAVGSALAWDPSSFIAFRLIGGIGVGASSVVAPAYIAEIAPQEMRGRLVALFQFMIVAGILTAFGSNYVIGDHSADSWRLMLGVLALPSLAYLIAAFAIPESPRWSMINRGQEQQALQTLMMIDPSTADDTLAAIRLEAAREDRTMSWKQFFSGSLRRPIMLAGLIAFFNQLSGINAIIYYAPRIFEIAGAGSSTALLATVGLGAINLVATLVGVMLIDKAGRKALMYLGSVGYIVSLGMTAYGFWSNQLSLVLPFVLAFVAAHAVGQGAVIWVYIAEIFPSSARAKGQSLGAGVHWVFAALMTLVMPVVLSMYPPTAIFAFFAVMMVLQLIWVRIAMVETRGCSLEEIAADLKLDGR